MKYNLGLLDGISHINICYNESYSTTTIESLYNFCEKEFTNIVSFNANINMIYTTNDELLIEDSSYNDYVKIKAIIKYDDYDKWYLLWLREVHNKNTMKIYTIYINDNQLIPVINKGKCYPKDIDLLDRIVYSKSIYKDNDINDIIVDKIIPDKDTKKTGYSIITVSGRYDIDGINVYCGRI